MIDPVPAQCVIVDREFSRRPFDRRAGGKQPLDPHPFQVLASLTETGSGTLLSRHWLSPRLRLIKKTRSPCRHKNLVYKDLRLIAQNYGVVMAISGLTFSSLNTVEELGRSGVMGPIHSRRQAHLTWRVVAVVGGT